MTPIIHISQSQFDLFGDALNLVSIIEKRTVSKAVTYKGKLLVPTMAVGTGTGVGWSLIKAREIVPLNFYTGNLTPLPYFEHFNQVDLKKRDRSYCGMLINYKGKAYVFIDFEIELHPLQEAVQTSLFSFI